MAPTKKKASSKKTTSKKGSVKKKASPPKKKASESRNLNPLSVLVIMGLATVIVMLLNRYTLNKDFLPVLKDKGKETITAEDLKNNQDVKEDADPVLPEQKEEVLDEVKLYFIQIDDRSEKTYLSTVKRRARSNNPLKDSLNMLISGPTRLEKERGLLTAVPSNLRVRDLRVRGNTAVIDFNSAIEEGGAGNILITRIDQIVYTATQFKNIKNIEIRINGQKRNTLGSDGLAISGPLHRSE